MGTLSLTKEARIHNIEKTAFSANGAGKIGHLHIKEFFYRIKKNKQKKNEIRTLPNTIHKNKLKMD